MKSRLKKKLEKKMTLAAVTQRQATQPKLTDAAALFATECWRIRKLLPEFNGNKKTLVLTSSVEKMIAALAGMGVEIDDPEQSEFRDGMTLKVALFEETASLAAGKRVITETLQPAIYLNDRLVEQAKVIVSIGTGSE